MTRAAGVAPAAAPPAGTPSAFDAVTQQAASIPAVLLSLGLASAVYVLSRGWWQGPGDATRIVPVFYTLVVIGALLCVTLLVSRVRVAGDQPAAWLAGGIAVAGAAAFAQGTSIFRLANAPLTVDPDGLAALYLVWHAALVVAAVAAVVVPAARGLRWTTLALLGAAVLAACLPTSNHLVPDLVDAGDRFTGAYRSAQGALLVASLGSVAIWAVHSGRRPTRTQVWITVALLLATLDMAVAAGAERLFESLWWSSAALRAAQFVVPAAGLLAEVLRLMRLLHRHERSLAERLAAEREFAAHLLEDHGTATAAERAHVLAVMRERRFHMVVQPIYSLRTGQAIAVEALARFTAEPVRPPNLWFEDAERCGLGVELELAALDEALDVARRLPADLALAVNLSPSTVMDPRLLTHVERANPPALIIEITEHAQVGDYQRLLEALARLRERGGVRLAIDDAGAGFSSLRHIVQLAPDIVKLDMSLTRDIHRDPVRCALAASLVDFAHNAGIQLVAEGVETADELGTLQRIGVHAAQGYLLARPTEPAAVERSTGHVRPWEALSH